MDDWAQAQDHANFVLLRPSPASSWKTEEATLRGESADHYASLRLVVSSGGLKVRLKQTLNDWWVPVANDLNLRRIEAHAWVGDEAAFLGRDYHGKPGACAQILGTTVEAYASSGAPSPQEWSHLYGGLEPAVAAAVSEARRTSFAERNYWRRWNRNTGPWDSHEFTRPAWMRPDPDTIDQVAWASTPDRWAPMPGAPDSVASLVGPKGREMQVLFRRPMTLNYTSWLRVTEPRESQGPVAPRDPRYPKLSFRTDAKGRPVSYAPLRDGVGPWFFAWQEEGRSIELHVRARKGLDEGGALKILGAVLP